MKYIRTKAGKIYDLIDLRVEEKLNGNPYVETSSGWVIYKTSIIKSANTIEELCDEFVFVVKDISISDGYLIISTYKKAKEITQSNKEDKINFSCYGAVWTDKGLIYVAKMNDKGTLELL